jgi:hypothetical protein
LTLARRARYDTRVLLRKTAIVVARATVEAVDFTARHEGERHG